MHVKFARQLPFSMLFGLTITGVGIAAPSVPHERPDDRLILIAESALHGVGARTDAAYNRSVPVHMQSEMSPLSSSNAAVTAASSRATDRAGSSNGNDTGEGIAIQSAAESQTDGRPTNAGYAIDHFAAVHAVPAHELDDMRGGFSTSLNLTLSFGIERAVYMNGALVTTTNFNLPAFGASSRDGADGTLASGGSIALVQNGPGNTFIQARGAPLMAATVIQNTLDNQTLQSLTTINTASNSLQILRSNSFQALIQDGISRVLVPH